MKKILYTAAVAVLVIFLIIQIVSVIKGRHYDDTLIINQNNVNFTIEDVVEQEISYFIEEIPINTDAILICDFRGDSIPLSNAIGKGNKAHLVRFSATGCRPCIQHIMEDLIVYGNNNPTDTIIVIIANVFHRDLNVFSAQYNRRFLFYSADILPIDYYSSPYIVDVEKNGTLSNHQFYHFKD